MKVWYIYIFFSTCQQTEASVNKVPVNTFWLFCSYMLYLLLLNIDFNIKHVFACYVYAILYFSATFVHMMITNEAGNSP